MKIKGIIFLLASLVSVTVSAERIKDIASIAGVRTNQLVGYGIVVGLNGTGDKAKFTAQSLKNMLARLGITLPDGVDPKSKNVAAVAIHATLPPFAKPGQAIDVTVSSIGDSKSLRGGSLLLSALKGADGKVYAIAQGNVIAGGLSASGNDGSKITVNIPSSGRIPNGATVERTVGNNFTSSDYLTLNLHSADFTTAQQVTETINQTLGHGTAQPIDASSIRVQAPIDPAHRVSFIALLENFSLTPGEAPAKIIINSRTGTVVINRNVTIKAAAVSHGSLMVTINETLAVSQPGPLAEGQTAITPQTDIDISEEDNRMFVFNPGTSLQDIVRSINQVGASPSDLVAILEALKEAGALRAQLVVI